MKPIKVCRFIGALDTQTLTVGHIGTIPNKLVGYSVGFFGSMVDGTCNFYGGTVYNDLYWDQAATTVYLTIGAGSLTNSGWTSMFIDGVKFDRASATYSTAGGNTTWAWTGMSDPFGIDGSVHTCVFR